MDSLTSRFNATLKLKEELEAREKLLASEVVEQLDPVRITSCYRYFTPITSHHEAILIYIHHHYA
jgi:hypothetical protein